MASFVYKVDILELFRGRGNNEGETRWKPTERANGRVRSYDGEQAPLGPG